MSGTEDPNWQASKSTVRERNAAMFNNELISDITFLVGTPEHNRRIPAHKYVLATGSSVFYAMFYGGLAEHQAEIEVPDVEPVAFLTLLRYSHLYLFVCILLIFEHKCFHTLNLLFEFQNIAKLLLENNCLFKV